MVPSLRESKTNLSDLVERASRGEEILITVRALPKARIVRAAAPGPDMTSWVRELAALRKRYGGKVPASGQALDEVREDRW